MKRKGLGFTLIELMIVVAIIGILSLIAYPSYREHVKKGKRAEAKTRLLQAAQLQERYYSDNNTYGDIVALRSMLGVAAGGIIYSGSNNEAASPYTIAVAAGLTGAIASSFALTATAQLDQVNDLTCGNLTLDSTGLKGRTGTAATVAECW